MNSSWKSVYFHKRAIKTEGNQFTVRERCVADTGLGGCYLVVLSGGRPAFVIELTA
jgi:hypothetical protein